MTTTHDQIHHSNCIIIGAGPVGLFTIFQCGMLGLKCSVIDALPEIGGQCTALYPEKPIYDIPAYPCITGEELIKQLEAQAAPFNPDYHLNQRVEGLQKQDDGSWLVETTAGTLLQAPNIILAAGAGAFGPNRPPLENLENHEKAGHVHYMVRQKDIFKDQHIVIAGGGDSAVDWAMALCGITAHTTLVHRRDKFRAAPDNIAKLRAMDEDPACHFTLATPYQLKSLQGDDAGSLSAIQIATMDGQIKNVKADHLLAFFGIVPDLSDLTSWGMETNGYQIVVTPSSMETTKEGIFAIGDVAHYDGKLKLILTGFAEAALAAHKCYDRIHPDTPLHFEYSTTKGVKAL